MGDMQSGIEIRFLGESTGSFETSSFILLLKDFFARLNFRIFFFFVFVFVFYIVPWLHLPRSEGGEDGGEDQVDGGGDEEDGAPSGESLLDGVGVEEK